MLIPVFVRMAQRLQCVMAPGILFIGLPRPQRFSLHVIGKGPVDAVNGWVLAVRVLIDRRIVRAPRAEKQNQAYEEWCSGRGNHWATMSPNVAQDQAGRIAPCIGEGSIATSSSSSHRTRLRRLMFSVPKTNINVIATITKI